jgi:hypothetical protein
LNVRLQQSLHQAIFAGQRRGGQTDDRGAEAITVKTRCQFDQAFFGTPNVQFGDAENDKRRLSVGAAGGHWSSL